MSTFAKHFETLQDSILLKCYHPNVGGLCPCGKNPALFRCAGHEYCFQGNLRCQPCVVRDHMSLPFHRIEKWTGTHFTATSLQSLGYILHLGHSGERCPNVNQKKANSRPMVIVHTNGLHSMSVQFCYCYHAPPDAIQLTHAQLFPATMEHPQTAFSFGVLDHFHQLTLSSKKPLQDYHDSLVKLTDPAFPQDVPV
jgi:hypothetical protein